MKENPVPFHSGANFNTSLQTTTVFCTPVWSENAVFNSSHWFFVKSKTTRFLKKRHGCNVSKPQKLGSFILALHKSQRKNICQSWTQIYDLPFSVINNHTQTFWEHESYLDTQLQSPTTQRKLGTRKYLDLLVRYSTLTWEVWNWLTIWWGFWVPKPQRSPKIPWSQNSMLARLPHDGQVAKVLSIPPSKHPSLQPHQHQTSSEKFRFVHLWQSLRTQWIEILDKKRQVLFFEDCLYYLLHQKWSIVYKPSHPKVL